MVLDKNNRKTLDVAQGASCAGLLITRSSNEDPTVTRSGNSSRCIGRTPILVSTLFSSTTRACVEGRTGLFLFLGGLVTCETDRPVLFPTLSSLRE